MSFDERQKARTSLLDVVVTFFRALAIAYLCLHAAVTWFAFQAAGWGEALLTFVLLGFGDLYWTVRWWPGEDTGHTYLALAAAILCFTSWLTRPLFNRWMNRFAIEMLSDATREIEQSAAELLEEADQDTGVEGSDSSDRPQS